jgi:hypothetical protein
MRSRGWLVVRVVVVLVFVFVFVGELSLQSCSISCM